MRKLLLLAVCLAVGCSDPISPDDFQITVSPAPATIKAGESMQLEFDIHNGSDEARYLAMNHCFPPFEILNSAGAVVGPGSRVCALALIAPVRVDANSTIEAMYTWTGDGTGITPSGEPIYLAPGTYQVRPFVDVVDVGKTYGAPVSVTIVP